MQLTTLAAGLSPVGSAGFEDRPQPARRVDDLMRDLSQLHAIGLQRRRALPALSRLRGTAHVRVSQRWGFYVHLLVQQALALVFEQFAGAAWRDQASSKR